MCIRGSRHRLPPGNSDFEAAASAATTRRRALGLVDVLAAARLQWRLCGGLPCRGPEDHMNIIRILVWCRYIHRVHGIEYMEKVKKYMVYKHKGPSNTLVSGIPLALGLRAGT